MCLAAEMITFEAVHMLTRTIASVYPKQGFLQEQHHYIPTQVLKVYF